MTLAQATKTAFNAMLTSLTTGRTAISAPKDLTRAVEAIRVRFGEGQSDRVTADRVEAALTELKRGAVPGRRHLFVLAHALAQPVRILRGNTVLEDPIGDRLLQHWEDAAQARQIRPSHWRGLFHSFLQAEAGPESKRLREILKSSMSSLHGAGRAAPPWLAAVRNHEGLLGPSPCDPYVDELLAGETPMLDDLLERVRVPDASWFWVTLRQAIVKQVKALSDGEFKERVERLLRLPERIPNARDAILAAILARYAVCVDRARDLHLMEFSLEAWGSPQLQSNRLWLLAGDPARHMVSSWLAREDLEDFYRLCKDAREVDDRRLRFWLRFTDQMGYTHILLGSGIRRSRNPDVRAFLQNKRLGSLTGGLSTNNAILMQIGGWLFVEFSEKGNACYAFPMADASIKLGEASYLVTELRPDTKSAARLLHMDGHETWETKFLRALQVLGIHPDAKSAPRGARNRPATRPSPVAPPEAADASDGDRLLEELARYDVRIVDNRAKGGAIWAYPINEPFHGHAQLRRLGMKFKAEKKGFYWP